MKKFFTALTVLLVSASCVFAQDEAAGAKETINKMFPNFTIDGIRESVIDGLYEISANGQIFYFSPKGYLVFGQIMSKDGKNITADRQAEIAAAKLKDLSLDKAIKIGSGKNKVIEISDPDCPYCRKASEIFADRKDVTRYVFLYPLTQIHPDAEKKCKYILCSKDTAEAYEEVFTGKMDGKDLTLKADCEKKATEKLNSHKEAANKLGIRGTPAFFINGKFVAGANKQLIEQLLKEGKEGGEK